MLQYAQLVGETHKAFVDLLQIVCCVPVSQQNTIPNPLL